jgi:hypothetical protein
MRSTVSFENSQRPSAPPRRTRRTGAVSERSIGKRAISSTLAGRPSPVVPLAADETLFMSIQRS